MRVSRELQKPWSLCELGLNAGEFSALQEWARTQKSSTLKLDNVRVTVGDRSLPRAAVEGLLLALLASEIGRREASEGQIWSSLQRDVFSPDIAVLLFSGGQPTPALRHAIELACVEFDLRHVFGRSGLQNWMDSIYLQFGFTQRGLRRLPLWLGGSGQPQAVRILLTDPAQRSDSFLALWNTLKRLRASKISPNAAPGELSGCPWVLPEWTQEVIAQASRRDAAARQASPGWFSPPRFRWDGEKPEFELTCDGFSLLDLDPKIDAFDVKIDGTWKTRMVRQSDGRYSAVNVIRFALDRPEVTATLHRRDGTLIDSETFTLWDEEEDVTIFRIVEGTRVPDPYQTPLAPTREHALLLAQDLELCSVRPTPSIRVGGGGWRIYRVPAPCEAIVRFRGELFWEPAAPIEPPDWLQSVQTTWLRDGEAVRVEVWHPHDVTLTHLRVNRQTPALTQRRADATLSEPISVRGADFAPQLQCHLRLHRTDGDTVTVHRTMHLDLVRMRVRRPTGSTLNAPAGEPTSSAAGARVLDMPPPISLGIEDLTDVQILPPGPPDVDTWCVMEGDVLIGAPNRRWRPMLGLLGSGAPLVLRPRPYNTTEPDTMLLTDVTDHGLVTRVTFHKNTLTVHTRHPMEAGTGHHIRVWWPDGDIDDIRCNDSWTVSVPASRQPWRPVAVALAWHDERIGAWWSDKWSTALSALWRKNENASLPFVRWLRLPLLAARHQSRVRRWATAHQIDFLDAWSHPDLTENEVTVVRPLVRRWTFSQRTAAAILTRLAPPGTPPGTQAAVLAAWRLLRLDPLLAGRVLVASRAPLPPAIEAFSFCSCVEDARREIERLPAQAARMMNVEPAYASALAHRACNIRPGDDARNVNTALNLDPFRRLVLLRYLLSHYERPL